MHLSLAYTQTTEEEEEVIVKNSQDSTRIMCVIAICITHISHAVDGGGGGIVTQHHHHLSHV